MIILNLNINQIELTIFISKSSILFSRENLLIKPSFYKNRKIYCKKNKKNVKGQSLFSKKNKR